MIDVDQDITIQKMISDAKSEDVDSFIKLELKDIESIEPSEQTF